jgi:hypothetical protein
MITGAHSIIYSADPDADRAFFRDVLQFPHVDTGDTWLIFALPSAELAVHPAGENNIHELYLMCDDIAVFRAQLSARKVACSKVDEFPWGLLMRITLPGGGSLGIYQPRHARPATVSPAAAR